VYKRKETGRFVIIGAYCRSVYLLCACVSDGRITGNEFRLRRGGFSISSLIMIVYVTSVLFCKERCNQMYYNDTQRVLRSGKL
jgi:hypothetical protein